MKLINKTKYSRRLLLRIAKFSKPKKLEHITITYKWRKDNEICCGRYKHKNEIVISLPKNPKLITYPYYWKVWKAIERKGYISHIRLNLLEDIVHVTAHEMRHALQNKRRKIHRVFGYKKWTKPLFSERDADAYAIMKQRQWRREHYRDAIDLARYV